MNELSGVVGGLDAGVFAVVVCFFFLVFGLSVAKGLPWTSWPGLLIMGCFWQYSRERSGGARAPAPVTGYIKRGNRHSGQMISLVVSSGFPLRKTFPSSQMAASVSTRTPFISSESGSLALTVAGLFPDSSRRRFASSSAFCRATTAAERIRAIFSSR